MVGGEMVGGEMEVERRVFHVPKVFDRLTYGLAGIALIYQALLTYFVASAFIAPGNPPMIWAFTAVVFSFLLTIDANAMMGHLSLVHRTAFTWGSLLFTFLVLSGVLALEAGRINLFLNGGPLASRIAAEHEDALRPAMTAIEQTLERPSGEEEILKDRSAHARKVASAIESASDLERSGATRPDIEQLLAHEGIPFSFSGRAGERGQYASFLSIAKQKRAEAEEAEREASQAQKRRMTRTESGRHKLDQARQMLFSMKGMKLTPTSYDDFYALGRTASAHVEELLQQRGIAKTVRSPQPHSLIILSLEGVWLSPMTGWILILLAFMTSFGPVSLILLLRAHLYRRWEQRNGYVPDEEISTMPEVDGTLEVLPNTGEAPDHQSPIRDADIMEPTFSQAEREWFASTPAARPSPE